MDRILILVLLAMVSAHESSYDSLVASQCKSRCLSLYPWRHPHGSERRHRSAVVPVVYLPPRSESINNASIRKRFTPNNSDMYSNHHGPNNIKWNKVMEMCTKNTNCLQNHSMCLQSCDLLKQLNEQKPGTCPLSGTAMMSSNEYQLIPVNGEETNCSSVTIDQCATDSDCPDTQKCCLTESTCGSSRHCTRTVISNPMLPSVPYNLTITERKKGKTVILSWEAAYNTQKPTMFVVEGQWSLRGDDRSQAELTKWGYLAQTVNQNWVILRSINRGRWYRFRVAAVSKLGSHGYSEPTQMFILSAQPKPPAQPENLTVIATSVSSNGRVDAQVTWLPSKRSDLPVVYYKLAWKIADKGAKIITDNEYEGVDSTIDMESELIDAQQAHKFTIKNLDRSSVYILELSAISKYEDKFLTSGRVRARVDTSLATETPDSSFRANEAAASANNQMGSDDSEDDEDDDEAVSYDEDDDLDADQDLQPKSQPLMTRNSPLNKDEKPSSAPNVVIRNLSVQMAYFQNGLVKAKSSWQLEQNHPNHQQSPESASILSKTVRQPPMFTLTWFPIKCTPTGPSSADSKQLPTPITATTINTHFEIYELKYNCEYVLNVRLLQAPGSSLSRGAVPQIASAQFRVPSCERIAVVGRIKPICLTDLYAVEQTPESDISDAIVTSSTNRNRETLFARSSMTSSSSFKPTPTTTPTTNPLPKIKEIRYKRIDAYTLEFYWSLPFSYNRALISGYQISVVPKDIPGVDSSADSLFSASSSSSGGYFGSVGAIVGPDQHSFVVRQLTPRVRYIFQIVAIGLDGQTSGPPSSIEFRLSSRVDSEDSYGHSSEARIVDSFRSTTNDYYFLNSGCRAPSMGFISRSVLLLAVVVGGRLFV